MVDTNRSKEITNRWSSTPTKGCDPRVARGIESLNEAILSSPSYSLTSKRYSVFTLIREHLDRPFEELLIEHNSMSCFKPSLINKPKKNTFENSEAYLALNRYQKIKRCLRYWEDHLRDLIKSEPYGGPVFSSMDSLLFVIYKLRLLKPKKGLVRFSETDTETKNLTTSIFYDTQQFCDLCWRQTIRYATASQGFFYSEKQLSEKYCYYHNPSDRDYRSNYIRDRRYKQLFTMELKHPRDTEKSAFNPPLMWYLDHSQGLDFQEIRKVAYDLVHSRLNSKNRKNIIRLRGMGKTSSEIARELGISRQAVSKNIKYIANKVNYILNTAYLDPATGEPSNSEVTQGI